jgi:hypothetical protein
MIFEVCVCIDRVDYDNPQSWGDGGVHSIMGTRLRDNWAEAHFVAQRLGITLQVEGEGGGWDSTNFTRYLGPLIAGVACKMLKTKATTICNVHNFTRAPKIRQYGPN